MDLSKNNKIRRAILARKGGSMKSDGKVKVIIMGAAGRDFHNFNVYFRDNPSYEVVAFTASQIPGIEKRVYPPELSGSLYPRGISIYPEEELAQLIRKYDVDEAILAYSDLSYQEVMHKASIVTAYGADFKLMGPKTTMLQAKRSVVSICAVRTGAGKSTVARKVCRILKERGKRIVVVRHPMPYGELAKQISQRFESYEDLGKQECTIEEREEYEPHIDSGNVVYAGVDYEKILREAEREADVIVWDGGNNDIPFYKPDLHIVVADPHRAGHEVAYYPGETNLRMADAVLINKVDTATQDNVEKVTRNIQAVNPRALIIRASSSIVVDEPSQVRGKKVLVVEDGPTVTHGGMEFSVGAIAAKRFGAKEIVDPRAYAVGSIKSTFRKYPHLGSVLPAMGYGKRQIKELEETINATRCDAVVIGTPINLRRIVQIRKPAVRVGYEIQEIGKPDLEEVLKPFL